MVFTLNRSVEVADFGGSAGAGCDADGTRDTDAEELLLDPACGNAADIPTVMCWSPVHLTDLNTDTGGKWTDMRECHLE